MSILTTYVYHQGMVADPRPRQSRATLSRERVLAAAVDLTDEGGIDSLTMRSLAERVGVEAMSLYHYVASKEDLLDGVCEKVLAEINEAVADLPHASGPEDWKPTMRKRILTAREIMLSHRWAPAVLETRERVSPAAAVYHHGLLEIFRAGGFDYDLAHHALHALGSRALGFSQELFDPGQGSDDADDETIELMQQLAPRVPLLLEMLSEIAHDDPSSTIGWCDDQTEFEFALDLLLDGLEQRVSV